MYCIFLQHIRGIYSQYYPTYILLTVDILTIIIIPENRTTAHEECERDVSVGLKMCNYDLILSMCSFMKNWPIVMFWAFLVKPQYEIYQEFTTSWTFWRCCTRRQISCVYLDPSTEIFHMIDSYDFWPSFNVLISLLRPLYKTYQELRTSWTSRTCCFRSQISCECCELSIRITKLSFSLVNPMGNCRESKKCRYRADVQNLRIRCVRNLETGEHLTAQLQNEMCPRRLYPLQPDLTRVQGISHSPKSQTGKIWPLRTG